MIEFLRFHHRQESRIGPRRGSGGDSHWYRLPSLLPVSYGSDRRIPCQIPRGAFPHLQWNQHGFREAARETPTGFWPHQRAGRRACMASHLRGQTDSVIASEPSTGSSCHNPPGEISGICEGQIAGKICIPLAQ